jgi:hypothetical protein
VRQTLTNFDTSLPVQLLETGGDLNARQNAAKMPVASRAFLVL